MKYLSIITPSHNNLRYLKNCYKSIEKYAPQSELIILDDASDDGTWEWLEEKERENPYLVIAQYPEKLGHTILYDKGVQMATNDIIAIFHADMIASPNTFSNMMKHLEKGKVVCATRIEPPLHPDGKEKIIKDFGLYPDEFKQNEFEQFVQRQEKEYKDETTNGMFAPWLLYKEDYDRVGGHDHIFAPFPYEDSDLFQRWILEGYDLIQARDSFVYHFTCRGHKWTEEVGKEDDDYAKFEKRARNNYIRKWGTWIQNDQYQHPIIFPKYDVGFVAHNCTDKVFELVEPWCSSIYLVDLSPAHNIMDECRDVERDIISNKLSLIAAGRTNNVVVEFDADKLTGDMYQQFIQNIQHIIHDGDEMGIFKWGIFTVTINNKKSFGKEHFKPWYKVEL